MDKRRKRWLGFLFVAAGLLVIWCVGLPLLSRWSTIREHIDFLDARGINASAMYYTEL
jgi:hypothetical protein